ncbi:Ig-like domain-containing protein, partial [Prevotella conceptionensis]|uniref:Ig-like domain-containing protein n=1 Tax=Prevotella conceptionensis TaxID=340486 RepID=UPI0005CA106B
MKERYNMDKAHTTQRTSRLNWQLCRFALLLFTLALVAACARMGNPDGGWYDETPPRVVGASPTEKATGVKTRKLHIRFNEFIKIENATENVVVSPPQLETPDIKAGGKSIDIELKDSLKANTTYTVDFSDAITDNNEGNPLGNYTYSFSTGEHIDTMEVSGWVLAAENLEPVKGILVGLYANLADSAFRTQPMLRVAKTDGRGHFVIRGIAPGKYRVYALQDVDGDYHLTQKGEEMAFNREIIVPSSKPDVRQDTLWRDSLRIDSISRVSYTHFLPDNITLRAFTHIQTDRFFTKAERTLPECFSLVFTAGSNELPQLRGLNFNNAERAFIVMPTAKKDTITYWIKDSALINQDTLRMQMQYWSTDTTGQLRMKQDTIEFLAKTPYAKRLKEKQKKAEEWKKAQDKAQKKGEPFETIMRPEALKVEVKVNNSIAPDENVRIELPTPLQSLDSTKVHLYSKRDTLWYEARYRIRVREGADSLAPVGTNLLHKRWLELQAEWKPGVEYSFELDSLALTDIYGTASGKIKQGFKVREDKEFATLAVSLTALTDSNVVVQLLNGQDAVVKQTRALAGTANFYYLQPATYYLRLFVDRNGNGRWDTGDFYRGEEPETVYYFPEEIECKANWDATRTWNPTAKPLNEQKPGKITKQKPDKGKSIKRRN